MSERKKVIPSLKELKKDLESMTFKQKVDHIWTYYKEYLLVVFLAVVILAVTITGYINSSKEVLLSGMMANISISQQGYNYLSEDYFEKIGGEKGKEVVELTYTNFKSMADPASSEDNYTAAQVLTARVSGSLLDYAIMDKLALEFYITQEVFLNLREFFTEEELAELEQQDMLVYSMQEGDTERWPVAVKMQTLPFTQDTMNGDEVYFIVAGNEPELDAVRGIWEHILAWEK